MRLDRSTSRFKHSLPIGRYDHPTRWSKPPRIGRIALIWAHLGVFIGHLCSLFAHVCIIGSFLVLTNLAKVIRCQQ